MTQLITLVPSKSRDIDQGGMDAGTSSVDVASGLGAPYWKRHTLARQLHSVPFA